MFILSWTLSLAKLPGTQSQYHVLSTSAGIIQCPTASQLNLALSDYFASNGPPETALGSYKQVS